MKEDFKELLNFFAAWFPDADMENLSDEEVVRKYLRTVDEEERIGVISQCEKMIKLEPIPLELLSDQAWRQFDTQEEAAEWLRMIKRELESVAAH